MNSRLCSTTANIEQGGWHRALSDRLTELEKKQDGLTARLTDVPQDVPDIHPNIAETYRRRIEQLTEALSHPDDALEAADAIREVIDRIVVTPGDKRGSYTITLQGELGTILDWIDRSGKPGYKAKAETASSRMSVPVNSGACHGHPRLTLGCFSQERRGCPAQGHGCPVQNGGRRFQQQRPPPPTPPRKGGGEPTAVRH